MIHGFMSTAANTNIKPDASHKLLHHYLFMNEYSLAALICPRALGNGLIYVLSTVLDSLLPVKSIKVVLCLGVLFLFPKQHGETAQVDV